MTFATCTSCKHWCHGNDKCEGDAKAACEDYEKNDDDGRKELVGKYLLHAYEKVNDVIFGVNEGVELYEEGFGITPYRTSCVLEKHGDIINDLIDVRAEILDMMVAMGFGF